MVGEIFSLLVVSLKLLPLIELFCTDIEVYFYIRVYNFLEIFVFPRDYAIYSEVIYNFRFFSGEYFPHWL